MGSLIEWLKHPEKFFNEKEVIQKTAEQLIKDFHEFSFDISFSGKETTPYQELFDQVKPIILHLLDTQQETLFALLYRIDLSETTIRKASSQKPEWDMAEVVTDEILKREMKKVLTKMYFSSQGISGGENSQ